MMFLYIYNSFFHLIHVSDSNLSFCSEFHRFNNCFVNCVMSLVLCLCFLIHVTFVCILKESKQENSICFPYPSLLTNTFLGHLSHFFHKIGGFPCVLSKFTWENICVSLQKFRRDQNNSLKIEFLEYFLFLL